ncbi:hypothetical protein SAMN05216304_109143 [Bosea sp. OK403]|uniref:sulfotransferase family 2 domain-containing protein n=1 Tax=Bosea sp. OK403 TaxID=1855286 RepID=UPI0008F16616|nr:sulfotransferase family 2 domain-containing protein [Bosea sp. OK403]SFJ54909.1 hypothetical protein SAMN05216304_109143 [Bosea sp. OK403]
MTRKTFYLHIPKTGGQSLAQRIAALYPLGRSETLTTDYGDGDSEKLRSAFGRFDFIESHAKGGVLADFSDIGIMASIRNPIDQIISHYRHLFQPNMRLWQRAVRALEPGALFDTFSDFFANFQSRCIVEAFYDYESLSREIGPIEALMRYLPSCLERINWFVPSEKIDEFPELWALENKIPMFPRKLIRVNTSQNDGIDKNKIRHAIMSRPNMYDFDMIVYNHFLRKYSEFRDRIILKPNTGAINDSFLAYNSDNEHVWLAENWYVPEPKAITGGEYSWWAGPQARSKLHCRLKELGGTLKFKARVFAGISPQDVIFRDEQRASLPVKLDMMNDQIEYSIDVEHLVGDIKIIIDVPYCYAPIQLTLTDDSCVRRSILTSNWRITR